MGRHRDHILLLIVIIIYNIYSIMYYTLFITVTSKQIVIQIFCEHHHKHYNNQVLQSIQYTQIKLPTVKKLIKIPIV